MKRVDNFHQCFLWIEEIIDELGEGALPAEAYRMAKNLRKRFAYIEAREEVLEDDFYFMR